MILWLWACTPPPEVQIVLSEPVVCPNPNGRLTFDEDALDRGIDHRRGDTAGILASGVDGTQVVATDLDGDGDVDLSFGNLRGRPFLFENDGRGQFVAHDSGPALYSSYLEHVANHLAADLDGDGLPELILIGPGHVRSMQNLGGLGFGAPTTLFHSDQSPPPKWLTASVGDADGDGDVDLFLPGIEPVGRDDLVGTPGELWVQEDGEWLLSARLTPDAAPGLSLASVFTDHDADGDLDLLVAADRAQYGAPRTALYRNDGGTWIDHAADLGADLALSGMGFTVHDTNGDGDLDYCISDIGGVRCLDSTSSGYTPTEPFPPPSTATNLGGWYLWSVEQEDFDNDGRLDAVAASGLPLGSSEDLDALFPQPDVFWRGTAEGFVIQTDTVGLASLDHHIGLAAADLDGDGSLEVVTAGMVDRVRIHHAGCTEANWIQVDPGEAWGARIEVRSGGKTQVREVQGLRSFGQSPTTVHFGLGTSTDAEVRIHWLDGEETRFTQPARTVARIRR